MSKGCQDLVWLGNLILGCLFKSLAPHLYSKNQGRISLAQNPLFQHQTRHLNIRLHWIRDLIENGTFTISYIPMTGMLANLITKALPKPFHLHLLCLIGLCATNLEHGGVSNIARPMIKELLEKTSQQSLFIYFYLSFDHCCCFFCSDHKPLTTSISFCSNHNIS